MKDIHLSNTHSLRYVIKNYVVLTVNFFGSPQSTFLPLKYFILLGLINCGKLQILFIGVYIQNTLLKL